MAVALDGLGRRLGELNVPTTVKGYQKLLRWAEEFRLLSGQAEVQDGELAGGEELAAQIGKAVVAEDDEHCGLAGMLLELSVVDIKILQILMGRSRQASVDAIILGLNG